MCLPDAGTVAAHPNERMMMKLSDDEVQSAVCYVLRGASEADWKRFTVEGGPYSITRLSLTTTAICRAVEAAVLARAAVPVVQPQEPVAWMWTYIGVDPLNAHIKPCARSIHEMDPANPPYPDSWKALYPLYAAPLARQEPKPDAVYPVQPSSEAATARDAARYRWLTEDHADPATREKCRELLYRMPVMSYAAASHAIDIAMQGVAEE